MPRSRTVFLVLTAAIAVLGCASRTPTAGTSPSATPAQSPVVLISLDGFRPDYLELYSPPALTRLAAGGVRADAMIPSFPTLTFPNHYTIVTGLYPRNHGIVNNTMYDPVFNATFTISNDEVTKGRWWGGEPIWVTAEKQGRTAATFFWPGAEAEIKGVRPSRWKPYDGDFPFAARVDSVLAWLDVPRERRPAITTLYFNEPDHASHDHGPFAPETRAAVLTVDSMISRLENGLRRRGIYDSVNVIVVSDHGMAPISPERVVYLRDVIDPATLRVVTINPVFMGWSLSRNDSATVAALRRLPHVRAWLKRDVPARLHFNEGRRITPIVAVVDEGWTLDFRPPPYRGARGGNHGYDNESPSMRALFLARGPAFRPGTRLREFANVHVYSLLTRLIGVTPAPNDGTITPFLPVLR